MGVVWNSSAIRCWERNRYPPPPEDDGVVEESSEPGPRRRRAKVRLADGTAREIQHMMVTSFWLLDGTPMSGQQFKEMLFGRLPDFFKNESEIRAFWSQPDTRMQLLQGLSEKGFGRVQLTEMQRIIDAETNVTSLVNNRGSSICRY